MTGTYIQMGAALIFVVLLIVGAGYVMKKKHNRFGLMNLISYQPFGPKRGVAALKVGKEVLILGMTQTEMRLLKSFNEEDLDLSEPEGFQVKLDRLKNMGANRN